MKFFHFKFSIPSTSIANMKRERLIKFSRKKNSRKNLFLPHPNKNTVNYPYISSYSHFLFIVFSSYSPFPSYFPFHLPRFFLAFNLFFYFFPSFSPYPFQFFHVFTFSFPRVFKRAYSTFILLHVK